MRNLKFEITEGESNPKDKKEMVEGLLEHHASQGHPRKTDTYSIFLKDKKDKVYGAVIVSFLWNGMEISSLWVDKSLRGKGWGKKLVEAVEEEAIKRGCTIAYTNTFTWQAPNFYRKLGYSIYGKLDDFPKGNNLFYYQKKLKTLNQK